MIVLLSVFCLLYSVNSANAVVSNFNPRVQAGIANIAGIGTSVVGGYAVSNVGGGFENNGGAFVGAWLVSTNTINVARAFTFPIAYGEQGSASTLINNVPVALFCGGSSSMNIYTNLCISTSDGLNFITSLTSPISQQCASNGFLGPSLASNGGTLVYQTGGYLQASCAQSFQVFKSMDGGVNWSFVSIPANVPARYNHGSVLTSSGTLIIAGGMQSNSVTSQDFSDIYSTSDGINWVAITPTSSFTARNSFSMFIFNNIIYIVGGYSSVSKTWVTDIWSSPVTASAWTLSCSVPSGYLSVNAVVDTTPNVVNPIVFIGNTGATAETVMIAAQVCASAFTTNAATTGIATTSGITSASSTRVPVVTTTAQGITDGTFNVTENNNLNQQTHGMSANNQALIGGIVGGVGGVLAIALVAIFYIRMRKRQQSKAKVSFNGQSPPKRDDIIEQPPIIVVQSSETAPLIPPTAPLKFKVYFYSVQSNERIEYFVNSRDTVGITKRKLLAANPSLGSFEDIYLTIGGVRLENENFMHESIFYPGCIINLIKIVKSSPSKIASTRIPIISQNVEEEQVQRNSLPQAVLSSSSNSTSLPKDNTTLIFRSLNDRNSSSSDKRREARDFLTTLSDLNDENPLYELIIQGLKDEGVFHCKSISTKLKQQLWLPEESDDYIFEDGASRKLQRNSYFTLIGDVVDEDDEDNVIRGLIKPLNLLNTGRMEGVNAIIWKASVENNIVVIKGLIPLSDVGGYESHFASHSAEFDIPLALPPHPHIISILHQFTASSVLVYPWISKDIRELSAQMVKSMGKGFVKRQTTYVVMEFYPSTLRNYKKEKKENFNETELLLIALQLFKGVSHLAEYEVSHRDLKDDNVFMDKDYNLVIADFGCALECKDKLYRSREDLSNRIGSPMTTAPEVFQLVKRGPSKGSNESIWECYAKNDIFSIGVMLYSLYGITNLPVATSQYSDDSIATFPADIFSNDFVSLMKSLLSFNPRSRPTASEAVKKIEMMLFGPKNLEKGEKGVEKWLLNKRLDAFFNVGCEEEGIKMDENLVKVYKKSLLNFLINVKKEDL